MTKRVPGWEYAFRTGVPCLYCDNDERVVLIPSRDGAPFIIGVCEACASHLTWIWRQSPPDASLADDAGEATRIKVVVARSLSGEDSDADHPHSYEFAMAAQPDGGIDFPTSELAAGEDEFAAVSRALAQVGLAAWPPFCETLYEGHTPRGRVARLVLVTACAKVPDLKLDPQWRAWPPWEHAPGMGGLYKALRHVWPLRIWKHQAQEPRTAGVTTILREGAAKYVQIQRDVRAGVPNVDTSMLEYLRRVMTDDEKLVDKQLREYEQLEAEIREERGGEEDVGEDAESSDPETPLDEPGGEDPEMFEDDEGDAT